MITRRDQYDFVTIADGIRVDGGIMPIRDKQAGDVWKIMRGEDIAFALEGCHERVAAVGGGRFAPSYKYVDRRILADRWVQVVRSLHDVYHDFLDPNADVGYNLTYDPVPTLASLSEIYPSAAFKRSDLRSHPDHFQHGSVLRADPIRDVFHDLGKLRRFATNGFLPKGSTDESEIREGKGDVAHLERVLTPGHYLVQHAAENDAPYNPEWSFSGRRVMTKGKITSRVSGDGLLKYADLTHTLPAILELDVSREFYPQGGKGTFFHFYYFMPVDATADKDGNVVVEVDKQLSDGADELGGSLGYRTYEELKDQNLFTYYIKVAPRTLRLILNLGDHTDFSKA